MIQEVLVPAERRFIKHAFRGLDLRPLHGETIGIEPQAGGEIEIRFGPIPVVAGRSRAYPSRNVAGSFPSPPVTVLIVALNLVRTRGCSPKEFHSSPSA